ncbi:MAG: nucleotidyltransferase domain-containing protein [Nanoarchaeota archaeon]
MIQGETSKIFTKGELKVMNKRLRNERLTQQDSNYLSKFIRPKLREIRGTNADYLLNGLEYNQKALSIENKIREELMKKIKEVDSITLYGSVVQNNYKKYNDIDILVLVNKKFWNKLGEKYRTILEIKKMLKKRSIRVDLEIYYKNDFERAYFSSPSLIYQLKDRKTIYGNLDLSNKFEISKIDLRMKADYSIIEEDSSSLEIYKAIRNIILIRLILMKVVDNNELYKTINEELGGNLVMRLKENRASSIDRKIAIMHLHNLLKLTLKYLEKQKWEKIKLCQDS